jgi:transposase-like protein
MASPGAGLSGYRYTDKDREQWRRWYEDEGLTVSAICDRTAASRHTIMRGLKKLGVKMRGNPRQYDRKAILRDVQQAKLSQAKIAKKHGCSQRLVSDVANGKALP